MGASWMKAKDRSLASSRSSRTEALDLPVCRLVVRGKERGISRRLEGSHEDGLQNVFDAEITNVAHGDLEFGDRREMMVDIALGVSIPAHHASNFTSKQNSLHTLVVQRESSKKGFPYLLGTKRLGRSVGVENFYRISEWGPEILKEAIKDVFKRVTVMLIHCHPGVFFSIVDRKFSLGNKSVSEGAAHENPTKLVAEDQEETVDMSGKVFMRLDTASCKCGIIRGKCRLVPQTLVVFVVAFSSTARAIARSTTISQSVFVVRHIATTTSKTRKVDASATASDGKNAPVGVSSRSASPGARSAQIRGAVSVYQGSLIR
jgi:hypothetical protein